MYNNIIIIISNLVCLCMLHCGQLVCVLDNFVFCNNLITNKCNFIKILMYVVITSGYSHTYTHTIIYII